MRESVDGSSCTGALTMTSMEPIRNKVAESDIQVFNLEDLWDGCDVAEIDIAGFLAEGLVLREKEFRVRVKEFDWRQYAGRHVAITCSTDAIVPTWAYMLIASKLKDVAVSTAVGNRTDLIRDYFARALEAVDWEAYRGANVVVKGCASNIVPESAYLAASLRLQHVASKIMYGEPCSSVPIWRRPSAKPAPENAARAVGSALPTRKA